MYALSIAPFLLSIFLTQAAECDHRFSPCPYQAVVGTAHPTGASNMRHNHSSKPLEAGFPNQRSTLSRLQRRTLTGVDIKLSMAFRIFRLCSVSASSSPPCSRMLYSCFALRTAAL